ncbi:hypothetical protein ACWEO4_34415 [Streptomyces sp. NPDC004393]|uniref:hypothetical protein n=1 Tax=Streptomyces sp. NPDC004533 TaxID=3154278 RepID=UPI0033B3B0FA
MSLDQQDAPGTGTRATTASPCGSTAGTPSGSPVRAYVHAPAVTVWEPTAADALAF